MFSFQSNLVFTSNIRQWMKTMGEKFLVSLNTWFELLSLSFSGSSVVSYKKRRFLNYNCPPIPLEIFLPDFDIIDSKMVFGYLD